MQSFFSNAESGFNQEQLLRYIKTYNLLKTNTPNLLEALNEGEKEISAHEQFRNFQKTIQENNFQYEDFVNFNARVGTMFSFSEINMETFNEIHNQNLLQFDDLIKYMEEIINNPEAPESTKEQMRKSLIEVKSNKQNM